MRLTPCLLLLALALPAGGARAEEAPTSPDPGPARRAAALRAARPAPRAEDGFRFEAELLAGGALLGHATIAAAPGGTPDAPAWDVLESSELFGAAKGRPKGHDTKAVLAPDLRLVSYERTVASDAGPLETARVAWGADGGLSVERTDASGRTSKLSVPGDPAATATIAGVLLLLRGLPEEPASYEVPVFLYEGREIGTAAVEVLGPARLPQGDEPPETLASRVSMGGRVFHVHLARGDRQPLWIEQVGGGPAVVFARKGLVRREPVEPVDDSRPAASAREAGVRFAVGILTGDLDLLARAVDWAAFLASEKEANGFAGDEAALREKVFEKLRPILQSLPRREAERLARTAAAAGTEAAQDGATVVRFGEPLPRLAYRARATDGAWRIVAMSIP